MIRNAIPVAAALLLGGCVYIGAGVGSGNWGAHGDFAGEPIFSAEVSKDALIVRVASNGCTKAESFDVDVDKRASEHYVVQVDRKKPDLCKAYLPDGVSLTFTFEELEIPAGALVRLANPLRTR